jgi:hypothetical protein
VDRDRLVETGQLEDLAIVIGQAAGENPLAIALGVPPVFPSSDQDGRGAIGPDEDIGLEA